MEMDLYNYTCINCGSRVKELCKKYSPTVLKLTTCENCNKIADKYVEYDPVIIVIDLVLLSKEAYRHVIFNTDFKGHYKLAILLQVVEAYSEMTTTNKEVEQIDYPNLDGIQIHNLDFHKKVLQVSIRTLLFIISMWSLTWLYGKTFGRNKRPQLTPLQIWKCCILSSFGMFLFLPSLIWGHPSIQEYHIVFVSLYTTFSQLLAYKVILNCHKLWSIICILISYFIKIVVFDKYKIYDAFPGINYNFSSNI